MVADKNTMVQEIDTNRTHLSNLEKAFYDLLQKYERAKVIIEGFQSNETILKEEVNKYEKLFKQLHTHQQKENSITSDNNKILKNKDKNRINKKRQLITI